MKKILLLGFVVVSAGEIISTLTEAPYLHLVCKPLLMVMIGFYYWSTQQAANRTISIPLVVAVLFSWIGDVLLMQYEEKFFMFGLASFFVAHLFYILTYRQHRRAGSSAGLQGLQKIRFAFPIIFAGMGLVTILYAHLGDLKIPVILYAAVLTSMVLVSLFRFGRTSTASFTMVFGGAILFMISDSLIAINKFLESLPQATFWIMLTYISSQYLIVNGLIIHKD